MAETTPLQRLADAWHNRASGRLSQCARSCNAVTDRGLFIIGAARTGTTILQNALNDDPGVFLLGEPRLHMDPGNKDFAERYNRMHRELGNQETKSTHCPALFERDAAWWQYLERLAQIYPRVGSKTVLNSEHAWGESRVLYDFHSRHFHTSHYIFTFRNPLDSLVSTQELERFFGGRIASHREVLRAYMLAMQLYIRMLRTLPHVHAVFHEDIDAETFRTLGLALDLPLHGAIEYYDGKRVHHYDITAVAESERAMIEQATTLYANFKHAAQSGFKRLQLEQNNRHLDPEHLHPIGSLSKRVDRFIERLTETGA